MFCNINKEIVYKLLGYLSVIDVILRYIKHLNPLKKYVANSP